MFDGYRRPYGKGKGKGNKPKKGGRKKIRFEALEPRVLLSADLGTAPLDVQDASLLEAGLLGVTVAYDTQFSDITTDVSDAPDPLNSEEIQVEGQVEDFAATETEESALPAEEADSNPDTEPAVQEISPEAAAYLLSQQQTKQIVIVDPSVEDYQSLIDAFIKDNLPDESSLAGEPAATVVELQALNTGEKDASDSNGSSESQPEVTEIEPVDLKETPGVSSSYDIFILDADRDGLTQISEILADYQGLSAVHLISHGAIAQLKIGSGTVTREELERRAAELKGWGDALDESGDILLYGCNVAATEAGLEFVQSLGEYTGADVAASDDATGNAELGGDWTLESAIGTIDVSNLLNANNLNGYDHLLAAVASDGTIGDDTLIIEVAQVTGGTLDPAAFTTADDLTVSGLGGDDTFQITALPQAQSATIDGGTNTGAGDSLDISSLSSDLTISVNADWSVTVTDGTDSLDTVTNVENIQAGSGTNTLDLSAVSAALTFTIHADGTVSVTDSTDTYANISGISNITGGTGDNEFVFEDGATLSGTLTGSASGTNTLDYSAYTSAVSIDMQSLTSTGTGGISNINSIVGGTVIDTLIGTDAANTWNITGSDAGNIGGAGVFDFSGIENVTGGSAADDFVLSDGVGLTGTIDGGSGGTDSLDYSAYASTNPITVDLSTGTSTNVAGGVSNIDEVTGGAGDDTLTGDSGNNTITGGDGADIIDGGGGTDVLVGNAGDDTYKLDATWWDDTFTENAGVGTGTDVVDFSSISNSLTFTVDDTGIDATDSTNGFTNLLNFESIVGGSVDDTFNVTPSTTIPALEIKGGGGTDSLTIDANNLIVESADFTGTPYVLTFSSSGPPQTYTIAYDNSDTESVDIINADAVLTTEAETALLNGLDSLTNWAESSLAQYAEFDATLPLLNQNISTLLDLGDVFTQLSGVFNNYLSGANSTLSGLETAITNYSSTIAHTNSNLGDLVANIAAGVTSNLTFDASGNRRVEIDFNFNPTRTTDVSLNLGDSGEVLSLSLEAVLSTVASMNLDATIGIGLDVADDFYIDINSLSAGVSLSATGINAGLNIGFIEADITNGTINLDAGVEITFADPGGNGASRLSVSEMTGDLGFLASLSASAGNGLSASLPFSVSAAGIDATDLSDIDPGGLTVDISYSAPAADDVFTIFPDIALPSNLQPFSNIQASDMLDMFRNLAGNFSEFSASDLLNIEIPFTDALSTGGKLGEILDFASAFEEKILNFLESTPRIIVLPGSVTLGSDSTFNVTLGTDAPLSVTVAAADTSTNINVSDLAADFNAAFTSAGIETKIEALENNGKLVLAVIDGTGIDSLLIEAASSSDTLVTELGFDLSTNGVTVPVFTSIQDLATRLANVLGIGSLVANFDVATKELSYDLSFTHDFINSMLPIDFSLGVGDFAGIDMSSEYAVLSDAVRVSGILSGDVIFTIAADSGGSVTNYDITVSSDATNKSVEDLLADINAAIVGVMGANEVEAIATLDGSGLAIIPVLASGIDSLSLINVDAGSAMTNLGFSEGMVFSNILALSAFVDMAMTVGIDLGTVDPVYVVPPIYYPDLPADGVLTSDAHFDVTITEIDSAGDPTGTVNFFSVTVARDATNTTVADLVLDIQSAIDTELAGAGFSAGDVVAEESGSRIALRGIAYTDSSSGTSETISRDLEISAAFSDTAYSEIGLMSAPVPYDGKLSTDALFTLMVNGVDYDVTVTADATNAGIDDLIVDINTAIAAAVGAGKVEAVRVTGSGNRFYFQTVDTSISSLGIRAVNPTDSAATELGLSSDNDQISASKSNGFFIEGATINGAALLNLSGLSGQASLGFLGLDISGSGGTGIASGASLTLHAAGDEFNNRLTLSELASNLIAGNIRDVITPTLTTDINIDLAATPTAGGVNLTTPGNILLTTSPQINWVDIIDGNTSLTDYLTASVTGFDPSLPDIKDLTFDDVLNGLLQILDWLNETSDPDSAVANFLNYELPLIDMSVNDIMSAAERFAAIIDEIRNDPSATLQLLEEKLNDAFGLPVGMTLDGTVLRIDMDFIFSYADYFSLNMDLDKIATMTGNPFLSGLSEVIGVSSAGNLNLAANAGLELALGIDLADPTNPFLYVGDGSDAGTEVDSRLFIDAAITGDNLNFTAQIGPAALQVIDGSGNLSGSFEVFLNDNDGTADGRLYLGSGFLSAIGTTATGDASLDLPLYLNGVLLDPAAPNLGINFADLAAFMDGSAGAGDITLATPDLSNILANLFPSPLGMLANPGMVLDGLDSMLLTVQDALNGQVAGIELPFIGDQLAPAAQFVEDFRTDVLGYLNAKFKELTGEDGNTVTLFRDFLFNIFASTTDGAAQISIGGATLGGLGILRDSSGNGSVGIEDIIISAWDVDGIEIDLSSIPLVDAFNNAGTIQLDFAIGEAYDWGVPIDFDIGLPGLGLEMDATPTLAIDWNWDIGFGVDQDLGFYLNTADPDELSLNVDVNLGSTPGSEATLSGTLGFLAFTGTDVDDDTQTGNADDSRYGGFSAIDLDFAIDLMDPAGNDDRLSFSEMISPAYGFGDIMEASATGSAHLDAHLDLGFSSGGGVNTSIPSIGVDLQLYWNFLDASTGGGGVSFGGSPEFTYHNIAIDMGSFITDFAAPFLTEIRDILAPLDWLLDRNDGLLYMRLPLISDLAGETVTLKDLAIMLDTNNQIMPFVNAVEEVYYLANLVTGAAAEAAASGGNMLINFGDFDVTGETGVNLRDSSVDLSNVSAPAISNTPDKSTLGGETSKLVNGLDGADGIFGLPFLEVGNIVKLLMGQDIDLVTVDLPPLGFEFRYTQTFPVFPPLFANISGWFGVTTDFAFGFDTTGISQFKESNNFLDVFNGLYVSDVDLTTGVDIPEVTVYGGISAGAELNAGIAWGGVEGGITANINFDLYDPNNDGKVRLNEMAASIDYNGGNPLSVFDLYGSIDWFLRAYVGVGIKVWGVTVELWSKSVNFGGGNIASFNYSWQHPPILAQVTGDTLLLNMGPNAHNRVNGNISDGSESMSVSQSGSTYTISGFGVTQTIFDSSITKVLAYGGEGNDTINLSGVSVATEIWGGNGNDTLSGGSGADIIYGEAGNDTIYGYGGIDTLYAGKGDDNLYGGDAADNLYGAEGDDNLRGEAGLDNLYGGAGNDTLSGGADSDIYYFENSWGTDSVTEGTTDGVKDVWDFVGVTTDITFTAQANLTMALTTGGAVTHSANNIEDVMGGRGSDYYDVNTGGANGLFMDGGKGSDTYRVTQGTGTITMQDTGDPWNKDSLIAEGTAGDDIVGITSTQIVFGIPATSTLTYDTGGGDPGIEVIEINLLGGNDSVNIESTPVASSVSINGDAGDDIFNVGVLVLDGSAATLNNITGDALIGSLDLKGGDGADTLNLFDTLDTSTDAASHTGAVVVDTITGLGLQIPVIYEAMESLNITLSDAAVTGDILTLTSVPITTSVRGGGGDDQINVNTVMADFDVYGDDGADTVNLVGTMGGSTVLIDSGAGTDIINIRDMAGTVNIDGGAEDDIINVGSLAPDISGGTVELIAGALSVTGNGGSDTLNIDNTAETIDSTVTVTASSIIGLDMATGITYGTVENLNIGMGSGHDEINVQGTSGVTTIDSGEGNDTFNMSSDGPLNTDTATLDDIQADVTLHAGDGLNTLNVNDYGDLTGDSAAVITSNSITGLSTGAIYYTTTGSGTPGTTPVAGDGSFRGGVNIRTGSGAEGITIGSTRSDDVTTLWLNDGNDVVTVTDDGSIADGLLVISGETGDDTIATTAWSSDMVLFGDYGDVTYNGIQFTTYNTTTTIDKSRRNIVSLTTASTGTGGSDSLVGGDANDVIFGGFGGDTLLDGGLGNDVIIGDNGEVLYLNEIIMSLQTSDVIASTGGDDTIVAGDGSNVVAGGVGSDQITTGSGGDIILGDNGIVTYDTAGILQLVKSTDPTLGGDDTVYAGDGADYIIGNAAADTLYGEGGDDVIIGDGGMITMKSGQLNIIETIDHFIGGDDFLDGGTGNNIIIGAFGSDTLVGDLTNDMMFGEYARIVIENQQVQTVVRLAQGALDLIGSNQFDLYGSPFGANAYEDDVSYFGVSADIQYLDVKGASSSSSSSSFNPAPVDVFTVKAPVANITRSEQEFLKDTDVEVVKGGTLWDLAEEYYGNAFLWEKIWKANPNIQNPDLIDEGQDIKVPKDLPEWLMKGEVVDEEKQLSKEEIDLKNEGSEIDNSHEIEKNKEDADGDESEEEIEESSNEADLGFVAVGLAGWRAVKSSGVKGEGRTIMNDAFNDMSKNMAKNRRMRWKDGNLTPLRGESKKGSKGFKII